MAAVEEWVQPRAFQEDHELQAVRLPPTDVWKDMEVVCAGHLFVYFQLGRRILSVGCRKLFLLIDFY